MQNRYFANQLDVVNVEITALDEVLNDLLDELDGKRFKRNLDEDKFARNIDKESVNLTLTFSSDIDDVKVAVDGRRLKGSVAGNIWTGSLNNTIALDANLSIFGVDKVSRKQLDGDPETIARLDLSSDENSEFIGYEERSDITHTLNFGEPDTQELAGSGECIDSITFKKTVRAIGDAGFESVDVDPSQRAPDPPPLNHHYSQPHRIGSPFTLHGWGYNLTLNYYYFDLANDALLYEPNVWKEGHSGVVDVERLSTRDSSQFPGLKVVSFKKRPCLCIKTMELRNFVRNKDENEIPVKVRLKKDSEGIALGHL